MSSSLTDQQIKALTKLSTTLHAHSIPYVVIGGLAAIAWGVERPLADIDIQIKAADMAHVRDLFSASITTDIRHYQTEHWDIQQIIISLHKTDIDICQAEDFYVIAGGVKQLIPATILAAAHREVATLVIPVMPRAALIAYKKITARPVDLLDLAFLEQ